MFVSTELLKLHGIKDANLIVGKYNILNDPVCNDIMGLKETIKKAFNGECVSVSDFMPPLQDLVDRGIIKKKPYKSVLMEAYLYPIFNNDELAFVVCAFKVKSIFRSKTGIKQVVPMQK